MVDEALRAALEAPNVRDRLDKIGTDALKLQGLIDSAGGLSNYLSSYAELGIVPDLPGRAAGGSVSGGTPYMVGERGRPEVFVPNQTGRVVPAERFGGAGTSGNSTTNHIDARGADALEQREGA